MDYPVQRNLDSFYHRVYRNGHFETVCFSDLTEDERHSVLQKYSKDQLIGFANLLADIIYQIGEELDLESFSVDDRISFQE